jgi:hypothetical protein
MRLLELLDLELITNVNMITLDYWMVGMSGYEAPQVHQGKLR